MLNKPVGYVTTLKDEKGRSTVMDLLKGVNEKVVPVGRLDMYTSGALILTNDGDLVNKLTHPKNEINKTYRNIDRPTDVISFALEDDETVISPEGIRVLGDIYICIEKVHTQANDYGHSFERELTFLAVHGV